MTQPTDRPGIDQLRNLADRAERGPLTGEEAARLRDGIAKLDARVDYLAGYAATLETYAAEQRERADKAEAERDAAQGDRDGWRDRALGYRLATERVRALHSRWEYDANSCSVCVDCYGTPLSYPCPTVAVLDQHGQHGQTTA
ncbi:hypothetical protein OG814_33225 [Streptomyces zaomyceticus]|uniref:Uncharacterized protein n=1 Tax=Streptomyces zaomyceticus TaxID=68286 RepID=A0ABZ1LL38_9ACTN